MPTPTPPTMRVAVEVGYVQTCSECLTIVRGLSDAALADTTVTRFTALPGRRHACGKPEPQQLSISASTALPAASMPPSGELFAEPPRGVDATDPEMRP